MLCYLFCFPVFCPTSALNTQLKKRNSGLTFKLPPKRIFGNNFDPALISHRVNGLNEFMQKVVSNDQLISISEVHDFLELKRSSDPLDPSVNEVSGSDDDSVPMDVTEPSTPRRIDNFPLGPSELEHAKASDFEFLKMIGKGSFGKVLLAKHKKEGQTYAVKVLAKKMILKRNEKAHNHVREKRPAQKPEPPVPRGTQIFFPVQRQAVLCAGLRERG